MQNVSSEDRNSRVIRAWTFYDWANSAYSLIITSSIFPAYYTMIAPRNIRFLGVNWERTSLASYAISFSFLVIAFLSPFLSSIADGKGNKKAFMKFFCYLGSLSCISMFFFTSSCLFLGLLASVLSSIGYCGSIVFYNAFLPEISSPEMQDRVSAKGFAMGYIGSVLLMLLCLFFIILGARFYPSWGTLPQRFSFVAVGLWWMGFAQITFNHLRDVPGTGNAKVSFGDSIRKLKTVWGTLKKTPAMNRFLLGFFFFNMGVQTVMYMATYFAADELQMNSIELIIVILLLQLIAIPGARFFAWLSERTWNRLVLQILTIIWVGICIYAYFTRTVMQFYGLAILVGLVMGGIQSLSRSTYSKLLKGQHDTASFFSFFDVTDKFGTVFGTLTFGLVGSLMGGLRNAVLVLSAYFLLGWLILASERKAGRY